MGLVYPTACVYPLIVDKDNRNDTNILQYFSIHGLELCIKLDNSVACMFYTLSFNHNKSIAISINNNKYFISFNTNATVFA